MISIRVLNLLCLLVLSCSTNLLSQDWWEERKDGGGEVGVWENENDGGYTLYFSDYGGDNAVATVSDDGGGLTTDEGEMKKAMEAAANGHTYVPEGEDRKKWSQLTKQEEGEGRWSWLKRALGLGKGKKGDGIVDGCDPKKMEDWMNGRMPNWGRAIIISNGQAPVRMPNPSDQASRISNSIR